ncbi:MAG: PilZ domain-containing protein [Terracidiphilus sp.]
MSEGEQARTKDARYRDRRIYDRFEVNAPGGCINYRGAKFPCLVVDVSLSGCCVRTEGRFHPGSLANVEIVLPILGLILRMVGTTQWVTRENLIGIHFLHASARSKNQLAGLLTCLVDESAAEEVKAAVVAAAQSETTALAVEFSEAWLQSLKDKQTREQAPVHKERTAPPPHPEKPAQGGESEIPRAEESEWPAVLRFLKDNSHVAGAIVGLTLEGCNFRTAEPFKAGIRVRVEVDFQMLGLPFLLAGVTENVLNGNIVTIRFLDLSYRKREELGELIAELKESAKAKSGSN